MSRWLIRGSFDTPGQGVRPLDRFFEQALDEVVALGQYLIPAGTRNGQVKAHIPRVKALLSPTAAVISSR